MKRIKQLYGLEDRHFYRSLARLSVPIFLQEAMTMLLPVIDNVMVTRLGDEAIAAVGRASQLHFLMTVFNFGVLSGVAVFIAQYWGVRDVRNIRRMQGIALTLMGTLTLMFVCVAQFLPQYVMGVFGSDAAVTELGVRYLRTVCFAYIFQSISKAHAVTLRNCGTPTIPMISAGIAVAMHGLLSYALVFGKLGFPQLGVTGAGLATSIAAGIDCAIVVSCAYIFKTPAAARLKELRFTKRMLRSFLRVGGAVCVNEAMWAMGFATCFVMFGRLGTQASAAMQINQSIDRFVFTVNTALATGGGVLIGNRIGANEVGRANTYAKRMVAISVIAGASIAISLMLAAPLMPRIFQMSDALQGDLALVQRVYASFFAIQSINFTLIVGILRPGGDALGSARYDITAMWLVSVPLVFLLSQVFHAPIWVCYIGYLSGDIFKVFAFSARFRGNWANDVTGTRKSEPEPIVA